MDLKLRDILLIVISAVVLNCLFAVVYPKPTEQQIHQSYAVDNVDLDPPEYDEDFKSKIEPIEEK
jgi:hypothetical protein